MYLCATNSQYVLFNQIIIMHISKINWVLLSHVNNVTAKKTANNLMSLTYLVGCYVYIASMENTML